MIYLSDRLPNDFNFPNPCNLSRRIVDLERLRTFSGDLVLFPPPSREVMDWLREQDIHWTRILHISRLEPGDILFVVSALEGQFFSCTISEWCIWK